MSKHEHKPRVVITGMGVAAPIGINCHEYRQALIDGKCGIDDISSFDASGLPTHIAAETHLPGDFMPESGDRKARFIHWATREAYAMSFPEPYYDVSQGLVSLGVGLDLFSLPQLIEFYHRDQHGDRGDDVCLHIPTEASVFELCRKYRCHRPPHILVSACAASADAIGIAVEEIRRGKVKWALAGGMDSMINPMGFTVFSLLKAMSVRNDLRQKASRPFDKNRDGFVMGEGAGALVLEEYDAAQQRHAAIYGEIVGYGNSLDASSISDPHPEGEGAALAMRRALADASLAPEQIDYINAHGTSTPKNDLIETIAIKKVFPHPPLVSSTKSMIGHCIAAAGVLEILAVFLCQQNGMLPPTLHLEEPEEGCDLDYIPGQARQKKCRYFLSNSFAFGGQNACLAGKIWES